MTMHVCVAVGLVGFTCRLTAEYGISSVPQHSTSECGTYLYLYYFCVHCQHTEELTDQRESNGLLIDVYN